MNNIPIIRDDLQVIGPVKTTGEVSVYKARRPDNVFSAVKLLPLPLSWEKIGDEELNSTRHELSKLKKLGEYPHNNLVRILNAGLSKTGESFYIEMDFLEGPNLEQLLQIPDHSILTVTETLNLAEQLCNALEHCHKMDVVHGSIKLSNVKWNRNTGNYSLVDFGRSVLQENQLRSRMPRADNKELAAPEEQDGKLSFQTDVFGYGIILFRLLAGTYPRGEQDVLATKNARVKTVHVLTDVESLRNMNIPPSWVYEKEDREKVIPQWLVTMLYKCLEPNPAKRFANGMELRKYLASYMGLGFGNPNDVADTAKLVAENEKLTTEKRELQAALQRQEFNDKIMHRQWKEINELVSLKEKELEELKQKFSKPPLSRGVVSGLIVLALLAGAFVSYLFLPSRIGRPDTYKAIMPPVVRDTVGKQSNTSTNIQSAATEPAGKQKRSRNKPRIVSQEVVQPDEKVIEAPELKNEISTTPSAGEPTTNELVENNADLGAYKVKSKAYFYNEPDESSRRKAFIVHWNNAVLKPVFEQDSYIYVVFTNHLGQTSKGWLKKNDLTRID